MIVVEKILGNREAADDAELLAGRAEVSVPYEWFECERGRMKKSAADGAEFGIAIPGGVKVGDILWANEEKAYVVTLVPSRLIAVAVHNAAEAARIGFELGNRHLSLAITETEIRVPYDEPTFLYLQKLGFEVQDVTDAFDGFIQCKAHSHSHDQNGSHHGDSHGHSHEHSQEHGYEHSHEHVHEHSHGQEHNHEHGHAHRHETEGADYE